MITNTKKKKEENREKKTEGKRVPQQKVLKIILFVKDEKL